MKKPAAFGKYFLLERINVGGMAEVFRAKAFGVEGFERLVAVKRILSNIAEDKEFIRMFIEEAKLSVQLNHANIAQIFDLGVVDGSYYIALEHVHGRDLRGIFERCRQLGEAMPVAQACFVAMKVCEGLDYAHNKRDQAGRELALVHRDVSPQNILVSFEGEVKLIDFGIAKAAGTGAKTQAGILKGKFGYMSPEQVRGIQVDRRSDVFSCGIVLYELLTGERLFVGESDFSTLEKVRNVEILPPSTYNRKIPDELERIVLKALAKDVEDRYQNAIDLHDELQAFVYTAGEFYSRKDLAGWMKKTFGKEIEEETAKLESYRQLKPPSAVEATEPIELQSGVVTGLAAGLPSGGVPRPRAATQSKPVPAPSAPVAPSGPIGSGPNRKPTQPPPPPPTARSQPTSVPPPMRSQPTSVPPPMRSQPITAPPAMRSQPTTAPPRSQPVRMPTASTPPAPHRPGPSSWDDDDLETRIFADDERGKSKLAQLPLQPPVSSSPSLGIPELTEDLPSDVVDELAGGLPGSLSALSDETDVAPPDEFPPEASPAPRPRPNGRAASSFANGSSNAPSPAPQLMDPAPGPEPSGRVAQAIAGRELSAGNRLVSAPIELPYDSGASAPVQAPVFGARIAGRRPTQPPPTPAAQDRQRMILTIVIGAAALAAITVIVVILATGRTRPPPPVVSRPTPPAAAATADPNTGFDLYVSPSGITQWKLDGESRTDRLPSRIRGIAPGPHSVQIDPPAGYLSQSQQVVVEPGKAPRVDITLQAIAGIHGVFESSPPGATVSLIVDGKRQAIGASPAKASLDPRSSYQVLFEKPGYVSVNRPIGFTGGMEERVVVNLEKAVDAPPVAPRTPERPPEPRAQPPRPAPPAPRKDPEPAEPAAKGEGTLVLGSKPPCDIAIDGSPTGLHTPQQAIKLPAGKHKVTLSNPEFSIKETFTVDIKPDTAEKMIKDYSDQLPK